MIERQVEAAFGRPGDFSMMGEGDSETRYWNSEKGLAEVEFRKGQVESATFTPFRPSRELPPFLPRLRRLLPW
jgi:hypothetical protein